MARTRKERVTEDPVPAEGEPGTAVSVQGNGSRAAAWDPTMLLARFPRDLKDPRAMAQFVVVCRATGLNPFLQEVLPLHGRAYITEAGWQRLIDERAPGQLVYDDTRMASEEEWQAFGISSSGWLAVSTIRRYMPQTDKTREVRDYAFVSEWSIQNSQVTAVTDEPWRQVMKTARLRALRKAFPEVLYASLGGEVLDSDVMADDGAMDGGGLSEGLAEEIDVQTRKEAEATERKKFWVRATKHGYVHGGPKLEKWLTGESIHAGKFRMSEWMADNGVTWFDLNARLDEEESNAGIRS